MKQELKKNFQSFGDILSDLKLKNKNRKYLKTIDKKEIP